jgi:hypothetical protein
MATEKPQLNRVFVKISDETKRRLVHLSVEAGAKSLEEFAGRMLAEAVDRGWATFDPKKSSKR